MVSDDIVERLRRWGPRFPNQQLWGLLDDAADEIERLRIELEVTRGDIAYVLQAWKDSEEEDE